MGPWKFCGMAMHGWNRSHKMRTFPDGKLTFKSIPLPNCNNAILKLFQQTLWYISSELKHYTEMHSRLSSSASKGATPCMYYTYENFPLLRPLPHFSRSSTIIFTNNTTAISSCSTFSLTTQHLAFVANPKQALVNIRCSYLSPNPSSLRIPFSPFQS